MSAAYNHASYLEPLAEMTRWWSDYLGRCLAGALVPRLTEGAA